MVCLALELVGPWVVLGFSVGMEALMSSYRLMFPGVRNRCSQDLDLSLLLLVFLFLP